MNERIRELAEQAMVTNNRGDGYYNRILDPEKFAELIVRDCIDIISPYTVSMHKPGEEYLHPIQEIKKHFGVEE